jgi:hypothetical protein
MNPYLPPESNAYWRYRELLEEAASERRAALLPQRSRPVQLRIRVRLAHALLALATWLSPDIARPAPRFNLARARRNGSA